MSLAAVATTAAALALLPFAAAAAAAPAPVLTCEQLETPQVDALATDYFSELLPLDVAGEVYLPTPERQAFLDRGGQYCAWLAAASPLHIGYSPITDADAAAEMARLDAAGLTRSESSDGVAYELTDVPGFTLPDVWGRYLFADGYWYVVKSTSTGSGGTSVIPVDPAVVASIQTVVETEVGPSPALVTDAAPVEPDPAPPVTGPLPFTATEPSVLSGLSTAADVVSDPRALAVGAGASIVLTALVAIPTALLNSALQEGYDRLRARIRGVLQRTRFRGLGQRIRLSSATTIAIGIPIAALITVFIDPRAGWNGGTARLFATTLAGFLIESLALLALVAWTLRRRGAAARVSLRLGSLGILALAVLATRVTGFEPGFVFGVVLAVMFISPPEPGLELTAARTELRLLAALALAAWLAYSALYPLASGGDAVALLTTETLSSLTVGGLTALFVLLLPVGDTPGGRLFRASGLRWGAAFLAAVAAFCLVVVPMPESWEDVGAPFALWAALFIGYCLVAVATWAVITFVRPRERVTAE